MMSITCTAQNWSSVAGKGTKKAAPAPAKPKVQTAKVTPKKNTAPRTQSVNKTQRNDSKAEIPEESFERKEEDTKVYDLAAKMPSFPGGTRSLMQFLSSNIKYPVEAENLGIQGRVICSFIVEKDGSISNINVAQSVAPSLDQEAVRVIKAMPKWIPGETDGEQVRVKYTLPLNFRLQ